MSGLQLEYRLDNSPMQRHMAALANMNTRDLVVDMLEYLLERVHQHFEDETSPDGKKWQPSQRVLESGGKTLQLAGHLHDSYVINVIDDDKGEIGSGMVYAAMQHFGGKGRHATLAGRDKHGKFMSKGHARMADMPAREALGVNAEDEQELDRIVMHFIEQAAA